MEVETETRSPRQETNRTFLSSWNEGPAKKAIVDFVEKVIQPDSKDFVPIPERLAVFDNDGTLWGEKPFYTQLAFTLDRIMKLGPQHPEWQEQEPFKSILDHDIKKALSKGRETAAALVTATHAGMTTDEFESIARDWFAKAQHPQLHRPYREVIFQPMLEMITYLKAHDFKIYIASAGGVDFMRAVTQDIYNIPPEQVIGSVGKTRYQYKNGKSVLVKLAEVDSIDENAGKPSSIYKFTGRCPILAFGNSDGDLEMLQWVTSQNKPGLSVLVHHTDAQREWAYDRDTSIGHLDRALNLAQETGWTVVNMKSDWKQIYPSALSSSGR